MTRMDDDGRQRLRTNSVEYDHVFSTRIKRKRPKQKKEKTLKSRLQE